MRFSIRILAVLVLAAAAFGVGSEEALAQGCILTRQSTPTIGGDGSQYMQPGKWQVVAGYRYGYSGRHFIGTEEQVQREVEHSEVKNWVHIIDIAGTYALTRRVSLSVSVPIEFAERSQAIRDASRVVVDRFATQARGIGDITVAARTWVLNTETHQDHNVRVGFGVKFPSGSTDVRDNFRALSGALTPTTVDTSIMPGDGGTGFEFDFEGFQRLGKMTLSTSGLYMFNPKDTITVPGPASNSTLRSVPDQYVFRVGAGFPLLPKKGLAVTGEARIEGVPAHDLIGDSEGFRRPGYMIGVGPGLVWGFRGNAFTFSIPFAVQRNRVRSVQDIRNGGHGDAAFPDYVIMASWAHTF